MNKSSLFSTVIRRSGIIYASLTIGLVILYLMVLVADVSFQVREEDKRFRSLISDVVIQNYLVGDIIGLQRYLDNFSKVNSVNKARLIDSADIAIWETDSGGRNSNIFEFNSNFEIKMSNGEPIAMFSYTRNVKGVAQPKLESLLYFCIAYLFLSLAFFSLLFSTTKQAFAPLFVFQKNLSDEASRLGIHLELDSKKDEFQTALSWFSTIGEEWKKQKELLLSQQTEIAITEFSRKLAHDIRSPLTALSILSKTANELPDEKRRLLKEAADRVATIANKILNGRSIGKQEKNPLTVEMIDYLAAIAIDEKILEFKSGQDQANELDLKISSDYGAFAVVNAERFRSLLSNLFNNSIEASATFILVNVRKMDNNIFISVSDNGSGIPNSILRKIGSEQITTKPFGNGIGLQSAFELVKEWNGEIEIESEYSKGTTVTIYLPQSSPPEWYAGKPNIKKMVIIDDDMSIHETWNAQYKESPIVKYTSLKDFYRNRESFTNNCTIVFDNRFPNEDMEGSDVAGEFKNSILISDEELSYILPRVKQKKLKFVPKRLLSSYIEFIQR